VTPELRRLVTRAYLGRLARSKRPILVGPWRSEVGFEALYWLPFLRWWVKTHQIDPARLVTVTRGGAAILYGTESIDLYRLRSLDAVRLENQYDWQRTNLQKQTEVTAWDRDVMKEAAAQVLGRGERYHVLHPSWMYWALAPFWDEQRGMRYLASMTDYEPIRGLKPLPKELPAHYVAMKWYQRPTFPGHEDAVKRLVASVASVIGAQSKIVLLTGADRADDHSDLVIQHPSVVTVPAAAPEENLAQQIQILAKAQAFVGTYGGMAQLALRLGVPSVSFYKEFGATAHAHLSLSSILSKRTKVPFLVASIDDAESWRKVLSVPVTAMTAPSVEAPTPIGSTAMSTAYASV
jgi:hypothetical protein